MTGDNLPGERDLRAALGSTDRADLPGLVLAHAGSPLAWAELADIARSEGRALDAYAYATVANARAREQLAADGWSDGDPLPWNEANQGALRAAYALQLAADAVGRTEESAELAAFLRDADSGATARIESEHTPTQLIDIIPPSVSPAPPTETFVIRGED